MKWGLTACGMVMLCGFALGCAQVGDAGDAHFTAYRADELDARVPAAFTRLTRPDQRLVSPVFSPTGQFLMARGWGGVGLAVLSAQDGAVLFRDPAHRGPMRFVAPGRVRLGVAEAGTEMRWAPDTGDWRATKPSAALDPFWDDRLGVQLVHGSAGDVYHHGYDGTITVLTEQGDEILVEDRGAWGVAATADGRQVAYSLGSLTEPRFLVYEPTGGLREVGAGAQPVWLPGDRYVVYTRPSAGPTTTVPGGYATDLYVYDLETQKVMQLTDTPAVAEMEPAVSPDGRALAFSDWNSGALYLVPMPALPGIRPSGEGVAP